MLDLEPARIRLIMELRRLGVTSRAVLMAIERTPRELFVPEALRERSYENIALPIGSGQTISQIIAGSRTFAIANASERKTRG